MKQTLKMLAVLILSVALVVGLYVGYLFFDYHRLDDDLALEVNNIGQMTQYDTNQTYQMMTYNIGYGSYPADFAFFMDGGSEVRARSKQAVLDLLMMDQAIIQDANPELVLLQEVDVQGDRSQKVNEVDYLTQALPDYAWSFAQNYDSSFLYYPILNPIGKTKSGLVTLSKVDFVEARRYSLPIDTDINKFFDLDRAFSINRFAVEGGRQLVVINIHLSAYTENVQVQRDQLAKMNRFLEAEQAAGHYVIVGGDFNHALAGTAHDDLTWMKTFPVESLPDGFRVVAPTNAPTVRNIDAPYNPETTLTGIIDGFILSDNVTMEKVETIVNDFAASDHHPVLMSFSLNE